MRCSIATTMRPWSKQTLQCQVPNNAPSRTQSSPCILLHTHGLQAHWSKGENRSNTTCQPHVVQHIRNHAVVEQANICKVKSQTTLKARANLCHTLFCTLTTCKLIEEGPLAQSRHPVATQLVSHTWCNTATNMRPWSKQTLQSQVPNHAQSTTKSSPCILLHTH